MAPIISNQVAEQIVRRLVEAGYQAYYVGGCVRDALLARPVKDIDIATSALPDEVEALFAPHTIPIGKAFGVVLVCIEGESFEVASFRADGLYIDGRRPQSIIYSTPECDAQRRDLTINALYYDPLTHQTVDYTGGIADLESRLLRLIGNPRDRLQEDKLRLLRVIRFASVLNFEIEPETWSAVKEFAKQIHVVSVERIANEIIRTLCESPYPSRALELLFESGLLQELLPDVCRYRGCRQPPQFHPEGDVWQHTCLMLDAVPNPRTPTLALGILLHDVGKPVTTMMEADGRITFRNHAPVGADMAEKILRDWKLSNDLINQVKDLVLHHMSLASVQAMRPATLRRWLSQPCFPELLELLRLDLLYSTKDLSTWQYVHDAYESFRNEPILPKPYITGHDLIAQGIKPGKALGNKLNQIYDLQLEGKIKSREEALMQLSSLL